MQQISGERLQDHWSSGILYYSDITSESPVPLINKLSDGQHFMWTTSSSSDSGETTEDYESHGNKRKKVRY